MLRHAPTAQSEAFEALRRIFLRAHSTGCPVVFKDPGVVTDEVVQLHLEQRVVQRQFSRFSAWGFVQHALSRE